MIYDWLLDKLRLNIGAAEIVAAATGNEGTLNNIRLHKESVEAIEELQKENDNLSQNFEVLRRTNKIQGEQISIYESVLPRWISVKERLPDSHEGLVLVCMPDEFPYNSKQPYPDVEQNERIGIAHYENCVKLWWMDGYKLGNTIPIAWMPLPEPPKEETNA